MSTRITTLIIDEQQLLEGDADSWMSLNEFCERCAIQASMLQEPVALGLLTPRVETSGQWWFRTGSVVTLQQALRLRYELELDWQGVAVAMDLMDRVRELQQQVDSLERQLGMGQ